MTTRLLLGDCLALMREMPDNCFDSIVSDAPYGMSAPPDIAEVLRHWLAGEKYVHGSRGFMSAEWDSFVPGPQVWTEALRVAKPGAHALVFASTRTVDLMGIACRLGGWEVRDTLHWLHYQGMPKGGSIGARMDALRDDSAGSFVVAKWLRAAGATRANCRELFGSDVAQQWLTVNPGTVQPRPPTIGQWLRLKALLDFGDDMDAEVARLNARKGTWGNERADRESKAVDGTLFGDGRRDIVTHGAPVTEDAAKWEGWHTHLSPAIEPILLLRKPLSESSIARNVLRWGTGALHIDACRLAHGGNIWPGPSDEAQHKAKSASVVGLRGRNSAAVYSEDTNCRTDSFNTKGRYPANLIHFKKPSRAEKEAGCEALPARLSTDVTGREPGSPGHENPMSGDRRKGAIRNTHPTVKPVALMRWCCRLVTPPGGDILDCFGGSGSTGVAAKLEGFDVTLCELDAAFVDIARARIKHAAPGQEVEGGTDPEIVGEYQPGLFG